MVIGRPGRSSLESSHEAELSQPACLRSVKRAVSSSPECVPDKGEGPWLQGGRMHGL